MSQVTGNPLGNHGLNYGGSTSMEVRRDCVSGFCVDCECVYIRGTEKTGGIRGGGGHS